MSNVTVYNPPPSLQGFLRCEKFVSLVCGPIGSGKSSAAMVKLAYHAKQMKPGRDGVRRSRAAVVRNTNQMLMDATLPTFQTWFPDGVAGTFMRTDKRFIMRFDDVELEVLFRGLDDANDVRRLLSLELSFGVLDEYREINKDIFEALQGRVGRYPSRANGGCVKDDGTPNYHVWGASNPPDFDTYWEQYMNDPPSTAEIFIQPGARSGEADWIDYLIDGYYETLAEGKTEDWVSVYIDNQFGRSLAGQPVFRAFRQDFHVAKSTLRPVRGDEYPLIIGSDFGLTPAATINQLDPRGRLLTYADLTAEGMGSLRFIREKLKPLLAQKFAGMRTIIIGDPAGVQRAQTDERSVFDIYKAEGFRIVPGKTNALPGRIAAVDNWLTRQVDGGAAHLIDPACKALISALRGGYRYKIKTTTNEPDEKPEKNSASHVADAHQYACLHADHGALGGGLLNTGRREIRKTTYAY